MLSIIYVAICATSFTILLVLSRIMWEAREGEFTRSEWTMIIAVTFVIVCVFSSTFFAIFA